MEVWERKLYFYPSAGGFKKQNKTKQIIEASDGKASSATGGLFLPAPARRLSRLGSLGWAGVAPKPRSPTPAAASGIQRSNFFFSERSCDLVGARVVWKANRDEKLGLRRPCVTLGATDGLDRSKGLRDRAATAPVVLSLSKSRLLAS